MPRDSDPYEPIEGPDECRTVHMRLLARDAHRVINKQHLRGGKTGWG